MKKKYPEKLKKFEEVKKKTEFKEEPEEPEEDYFNFFDENDIHKFTGTKYDFNGFDKYGKHKKTDDIYDPNGSNVKGLHKDTNTFFNKEKSIRKDMLKNINLLKNRDEFLKLYNEIIKNGEFGVDNKNDHIKSSIFKTFLEDILSGKIKYNDVEYYTEVINDIGKKNSPKIVNNDILKNYIKKIKYLLYGKDKEKIKTDQAKSFEDQKGKGYVNLPIVLFKIYTNNSSKELINDIKQLINNLYNNKQITKQA